MQSSDEVDVEIRAIEEYIQDNKKIRRVVFRIKGEKVLKDMEIDPNRHYSEEELKEVIKCKVSLSESSEL